VLRGKHKRYQKIYLYAIDGCHPDFHSLPDEDFIGYWEEDEDLSVLFFHHPKDDLVERLLAERGLRLEAKACVDFEDWGEGRRIKPFLVGPYRFAPEWLGGADLYFDPGVVFGSGTHPTTRLCLDWLYRWWQEYGPFSKVADLGCGSGLISLLAARLGAEVMAIDRNPLCVTLTQKNAHLNGLSSRIKVFQGDVMTFLPLEAELVVANLYKGLLLELFGLPSFWKNRYYLFSGFGPSMEEELQRALTPYAEILGREERKGWVLYAVRSKVRK